MRAFILLLAIALFNNAESVSDDYYEKHKCNLDAELVSEIRAYESKVQEILSYFNGPFKGHVYHELEKFIDTFGPRESGTQVLENAIDYMINITKAENIQDVTTENVEVPYWNRGEESATMLQPRMKKIALLGLGYSVSTPAEGITAQVVVVDTIDEFNALPEEQVKGKIVLFNPTFTTYSETVKYRSQSASLAASKGAVASLVGSITPFSIYTPHTGAQTYTGDKKIPTAAITKEDAHYIRRLYKNHKEVVLHLKMSSTLSYKTSRNTLIDIKGTVKPDQQVIVSGHIDSWDVGTGAMDDGGGMIISWAVPVVLNRLNLQPKRTVRALLFTAEELGLIGAESYAKTHEKELQKINFIMESDEGTFAPLGLGVAGNHKTRCIVAEVLKLFSHINATLLEEEDAPGSDITVIIAKGVPGAGLLNANDRYFWFHHTNADTMDVIDQNDLEMCAALYTAVAYIIADLSLDIPRD